MGRGTPGQDRVPLPPPPPPPARTGVLFPPLPLARTGIPSLPSPSVTSPPLTRTGVPLPPPQPGQGYPSLPTTPNRTRLVVWRGRYASCVHVGGLSCFLYLRLYYEVFGSKNLCLILHADRLALGVGDNMIRVCNLDSSIHVLNTLTLWQGIKSKVTSVSVSSSIFLCKYTDFLI